MKEYIHLFRFLIYENILMINTALLRERSQSFCTAMIQMSITYNFHIISRRIVLKEVSDI